MLLQDILSIILLVNHKNTHSIFFTITSTTIILGLLFLVGKKVINNLFKRVSDSFEFILFIAFIIIIGLSLVTDYMGLSSELGAVLSGFLLAETDYKEYIEDEITNIKEVLLAIFFMTTGMYLPINFFLANWQNVLLLLFVVLFLKFIAVVIGARIFLLNNVQSVTSGLMLLSIGEPVFIFVNKILPEMVSKEVINYLLLITVLSIIISPIIFKIYFYFYQNKLEGIRKTENEKFIIVGCNDMTKLIITIFEENQIDYMAIDNDINRVNQYKNKGYNIKLTDYKDTGALMKIIKNANGMFFSYIPSDFVINQAIKYSKKSIFIKVQDIKDEEKFKKLGLIPIRIDIYDEAYKMCSTILPEFGIDESEIEKVFLTLD
jgi:CPA2 family monovalent cation:H+ antiporter-2